MWDQNFLEHYANDTITDARDFMERERLTRHGSTLEVGSLPGWLVVALVLVFIGLLIVAL